LTVEHLAILGIAIFGFMAVMNLYTALRTLKRSKIRPLGRMRRLIGGPDAARAVAMSVVREIADRYPEELSKSQEVCELTPPLEEALQKGREYYLSRVEPIHRGLFTDAIDHIVFERESVTSSDQK
jgi:hypothetical protein